MSEQNAEEVVLQQVEGGKWHRQWWPREMEGPRRIFVTHVGMFDAKRHPRLSRSKVATSDLCRVCFPPRNRARQDEKAASALGGEE